MRISEALRRRLFQATPSGIINYICKAMNLRRSILMPEALFAECIAECEASGRTDETGRIGYEWGLVGASSLRPPLANVLSPLRIMNSFVAPLWKSLGFVDSIECKTNENKLTINSRNENVTRCIGANNSIPQFYGGVWNGLTGRSVKFISCAHSGSDNIYTYQFTGNKPNIRHKPIDAYRAANRVQIECGVALQEALKASFLELSGTVLNFRGYRLLPFENTLFHLCGDSKEFLRHVPRISAKFFGNIVQSDERTKLLITLKTFLQVTGWGHTLIENGNDYVTVVVYEPPIGFQLQQDRWDFLAAMIEGYLQLIDKRLGIESMQYKGKTLTLKYSPEYYLAR